MKVYICPKCGWMRTVSRRSQVECFKCSHPDMTLCKISYEQYTAMDESERKDYAHSWMYINDKKGSRLAKMIGMEKGNE
jgi:ribosomal protein L37AE/L43A